MVTRTSGIHNQYLALWACGMLHGGPRGPNTAFMGLWDGGPKGPNTWLYGPVGCCMVVQEGPIPGVRILDALRVFFSSATHQMRSRGAMALTAPSPRGAWPPAGPRAEPARFPRHMGSK